MIMEIVNIETSAFIEMNNALLKIEKQLKSQETCKSGLNDYMKRNINTFINNNGNGTGCIE